MEKKIKNNDLFYQIFKFSMIFLVVVLYICSMYLNYDANKRFDQLWSVEYKETGIQKGFKFTEEAKAEPIFYHSWSCSTDQFKIIGLIKEDLNILYCDHCSMLGNCQKYEFKLFDLQEPDLYWQQIHKDKRSFAHGLIEVIVFYLIFVCLLYWIYQWKCEYENWIRTPFAGWTIKIIKKIKESDQSGKDRKN